MANILGLLTVNNKEVLEVDAIPSAGAGTPAPVGSIAFFETGSNVGELYLKVGIADTAWDKFQTAQTGAVGEGEFLRIPIYDTDPSGYHVDDVVTQNAKNITVSIVPQASRTQNISYRIPNPGDAVTSADFVLTEGVQTINGDKTFTEDVVVQGDLTVNGSLTYLNTTNTEIRDALITLNKGGGASSGSNVGFEIEENASITGYFKTTVNREGWQIKAPAIDYTLSLFETNLSANRSQYFADSDGVFVYRGVSDPGVQYQICFYSDANRITSSANFTFDSSTNTLTMPNLVVTTSAKLSYLTQGSVVFVGVDGVLTEDNANLFFDDTNNYLGIGTNTPSRRLDVNGTSIIRGELKYVDADATKNSWEMFQAQVSTNDNTETTLTTIAVPTDKWLLIEARVVAKRTGGTAGNDGDGAVYVRTVCVKNIDDTLTLFKTQSDYTQEDQKSWDALFDVSGTNLRLRVKGAANNNIDWTTTYFVQVV